MLSDGMNHQTTSFYLFGPTTSHPIKNHYMLV